MRKHSWQVLAPIAAMVVALATSPAASQEEGPARRGGKGYFMIGWTSLDVDPLNAALGPKGYEDFDSDALSLGGAGHAQIGRFVIGGQGYALVIGDRDANLPSAPFRTRLRSGAGLVDVGGILWQGDRIMVTPLVGLGMGTTLLQAVDRRLTSFDEATDDPRLGAEFVRSAFLVDLGAMADVIVPLGRRHPHVGGLVIGLRAGYVLAPAEGDWHFDDRALSGGPDGVLTGPYARILFGAGGWRR